MSLTVLHVLASTRADHGGTSRSIPLLCEALDAQGLDVHLVTAAPPGGGDSEPILPGEMVRSHIIEESGLVSSRLRSPVAFYQRLSHIVEQINPDIVHDHGAWLPSNAVAAWMAWQYDVPLVTSTRGMLTDWALSHKAWKKWFAWYGYQKWTLRQASCFHVTAEVEARGLRALGFTQPAAVVPNGVSFPETVPSRVKSNSKRALFLSRIHPKKGLPMLLEAWARIRPENWTLEIVGPDDGDHRTELEDQAQALNLDREVRFTGPVDDTEKWDKYAAADLFVLPSHSENFGIVVAESLAAGVPVVTTTGTPWEELEIQRCGWWVDPDPDALQKALQEAIQCSPDVRRAMGERGRGLVEQRYSWSGVAERMRDTYHWMIADERLSRPDWVQ